MATTSQTQLMANTIVHGNCIDIMRGMQAEGVDFILADPPYLVNFRDRKGRTLQNDIHSEWLKPSMKEAYRVLRNNRLMFCFYGWPRAEKFLEAWREAGFRPVGHIVFQKSYATQARFLQYRHEQGYLLAKGNPALPKQPISDVQPFLYTGNKMHPTQKAVMSLIPILRSYTRKEDLILDAFCGSGSTCAAALLTGRRYLGIELDSDYHREAILRMSRIHQRIATRRAPDTAPALS